MMSLAFDALNKGIDGAAPYEVIEYVYGMTSDASSRSSMLPLVRFSPQAPEELERVAKALAKDREQRYQSAKDLFIDLRRTSVRRPHSGRWRSLLALPSSGARLRSTR